MKSVVLLSSGLDSTVNLYKAVSETRVEMALTFDYGQRAAKREIEYAAKSCDKLKVRHKIIELPWFRDFTQTSLVNHQQTLATHVQIDNLQASQTSAKNVWVPNRNGIFLNIGAAYAEGVGADFVVPGFNIEEGATFADNTQEYLDALTNAFCFSTANQVKAICYTTAMNKTEIVRMAKKLGVDFSHIWPCYQAFEKHCGVCESCQRYERAMREA